VDDIKGIAKTENPVKGKMNGYAALDRLFVFRWW